MNIGRICLIGLILPTFVFAGSPEILVNGQGLAQQDLSIRGSSYTEAGLSINGINLKVPYSAHFNADLPLYGPLLSDAHIQKGLANISGHPIGTSALSTRFLEPQMNATIAFGTKERYRTSSFASTTNVAGYLEWEKARAIDYDANDLERFTGMAAAQLEQNDWRLDLLTAGQSKEYGAQGYYGIPANVYAKEETEDSLLLASAFKGDLDGSFLRAGASLREFNDEYRIPYTNFTSDVRSRYGSVMIEGRTLEIQNLALNLRGDLEHERISGDLGQYERTRASMLILPEVRLERVTLKGGVNSAFQTEESAEWLPQAGIDYFATDNIRLYAAYSETVMQPDFQTLYYSDPYHTGNSALQLQKSRSVEAGLHQFLSAQLDWNVAAFHRRQENATDWTKANAASTAWTATDLGNLDVTGIDAKVNYLASEKLKFELYYQWITKDEYDVYAGLYELDYPAHLLAMSGFWKLTPELQLFGTQTLRYQTDNKARSGNDFGAEASLGLHYAPRFAKNMRLSFLVENLWDSDFQAIPGLKPRPIAASTGITIAW